MAARIESGAAMLCHAWLLTRKDGEREWVSPITTVTWSVDGVVCRAASGWTAGAAETAAGLTRRNGDGGRGLRRRGDPRRADLDGGAL
jgi:hypothetical protein